MDELAARRGLRVRQVPTAMHALMGVHHARQLLDDVGERHLDGLHCHDNAAQQLALILPMLDGLAAILAEP